MMLFGVIPTAIPAITFATVPEVMNDPRQTGLGLAVLSIGTNLGVLIGPFLVGKLIETMGWAVAGYWLVPICILGFVLAWKVKIR